MNIDDMTPAQLNHAIAVEVFGWRLNKVGYWDNWTPSGKPIAFSAGSFRPADDERCLHWAVKAAETISEAWSVSKRISHNGIDYTAYVDGPWIWGEAKTPGEALCRAALKAKRAKEKAE